MKWLLVLALRLAAIGLGIFAIAMGSLALVAYRERTGDQSIVGLIENCPFGIVAIAAGLFGFIKGCLGPRSRSKKGS